MLLRRGTAGTRRRRKSWPRVPKDIEARWHRLNQLCADGSSQIRLGRLIDRLGSVDPGTQESALAELELATLLIRAGARVQFLPESQARTADLECRAGSDRFFAEVTAMVGSTDRRRFPLRGITRDENHGDEEDRGVILIHRILARIEQKAKQLGDYCDPVVLAVSIPRADLQPAGSAGREQIRLDLKRLAGLVSLLLPKLRHLSAVLITLWDVEPLPAPAAVRLANVALVERTKHQQAYPRVRLLVYNPAAGSPMTQGQQDMLRGLL